MATKTTKAAAEKKQPIPRDHFGSRVGSVQHKINTAVGKKPKTAAEILQEAGVKNGFYHLRALEEKGYVERVDGGGYRVTGKRLETPKKGKAKAAKPAAEPVAAAG